MLCHKCHEPASARRRVRQACADRLCGCWPLAATLQCRAAWLRYAGCSDAELCLQLHASAREADRHPSMTDFAGPSDSASSLNLQNRPNTQQSSLQGSRHMLHLGQIRPGLDRRETCQICCEVRPSSCGVGSSWDDGNTAVARRNSVRNPSVPLPAHLCGRGNIEQLRLYIPPVCRGPNPGKGRPIGQ